MQKSTPAELARRFFTGTGSSYDLIVNLFTYGADRYWKRMLVAGVPSARQILDLACGTGILTLRLAQKNGCSRIVGVDMMPEYLSQAVLKKQQRRCGHVFFVCARAEEVQFRHEFDCITSSYLPKYVPADQLLANISGLLRPGGVLLLHDFTYPARWPYRRLWEWHMSMMKFIGRPLFPQWRPAFEELQGLVQRSRWLSEYIEALPRFGFAQIRVRQLTLGSAAILSAVKDTDSKF